MKLDPRISRMAPWALSLALLSVPVAGAGAFVWLKHHWAQDRLHEIEPRYARLLGLEAQHVQLEDALDQAAQLNEMYLYPASQDASQVGNDAQRRIRDLCAKAGLDVVSSQVLQAKADHQFDRVPVTVRFEGEMVAVQSALVAISAQTSPAILIESMTMQVVSFAKPDAPARLGGQINFFVLRAN